VTVVEFLDRIIPGTDADVAKKFMTVRLPLPLAALHLCCTPVVSLSLSFLPPLRALVYAV
jgi:hypothetical protein